MPPCKRQPAKTEYRRSSSIDPTGKASGRLDYSEFTVHPADQALNWFVQVRWHEFASCYVYYDSPLFNEYGEIIGEHQGNTIYLNPGADHVGEDLLHEIGHAVARHFNLIGVWENYYYRSWERVQQRLIGAVTHGRHWSRYLNEFAANTEDFSANAASELWAELFMLFYLYPGLPESELIASAIDDLRHNDDFQRLEQTLHTISSSWQLPGVASRPRSYPAF